MRSTNVASHFRKGDLVQAEEDLTAAIARYPAPQFYANRGHIYEARRRTQDAISDFRLALLGDPSLVHVLNALKRLGAETAIASETEKRIHEGEALAGKTAAAVTVWQSRDLVRTRTPRNSVTF